MTRSYPSLEYWKLFETSEVVVAGGATFATSAKLAQVVVTLFRRGVGAGAERMRARLYHDFALTKLYATGDWTDLAAAWGDATNWRGSEVPLNFATPPWVEAGREYFIAIETDGYTRVGDTFFIGLAKDWPLPFNDNANALAMRFWVWQGSSY